MKFQTKAMMFGAALLFAAPAFAQDAPATTTTPAAPATTTAPTAPATGATAVTDTEVSQFAAAALAIDKVRTDAAVAEADKTAKYIEAINAAGLQPARFNEIATAMQSDTALNTRIQKAGAAAQGSAAPAAPAQ